jgi:hypothetical protein
MNTAELKERILAIYQEHAPDKVDDVPGLFEKYLGERFP